MSKRDVVAWTSRIRLQWCNGRLAEARAIFDRMPARDAFAWNTLVAAYAQAGHLQESRSLFLCSPERDLVTWNSCLKAYTDPSSATEMFDRFPARDVFSCTSMLALHARCGQMLEARRVFNEMPVRNAVSWNALLSGYVSNRCIGFAALVFERMPSREIISFNYMIEGFAASGQMLRGWELFTSMEQRNAYTWTTLVVSSSDFDQAVKAFERMPLRNLAALAALIAADAEKGQRLEDLLQEIPQQEDADDLVLYTGIIESLSVRGRVEEAGRVFDRMSFRDVVAYTAMICAYAKSGQLVRAREMFVQASDVVDAVAYNAMLAAYVLNGDLSSARRFFEGMPWKDMVSWSTMVAGYAYSGQGLEALYFFRLMELEGEVPDEGAVLAALVACSHAGMVAVARAYFVSMQERAMEAGLHHFCCVAAALGRAGRIAIAEELLLEAMPFFPDKVSWKMFMASCSSHGYVQKATVAAERAVEASALDDSGPFVAISNLYTRS